MARRSQGGGEGGRERRGGGEGKGGDDGGGGSGQERDTKLTRTRRAACVGRLGARPRAGATAGACHLCASSEAARECACARRGGAARAATSPSAPRAARATARVSARLAAGGAAATPDGAATRAPRWPKGRAVHGGQPRPGADVARRRLDWRSSTRHRPSRQVDAPPAAHRL